VILPDVMVVHVTIALQFSVDGEMNLAVQQTRQQLLAEARTYDTEVGVDDQAHVPGLVARLDGAVREAEFRAMMKRCSSPLAFFIWVICFVTGFQAIFECFATPSSDECTVECVKRMGRGTGFRCHYGEMDEAAAEIAINHQMGQSIEKISSDVGAAGGSMWQPLI
jgi:hypothetical protein